jgi:hypothetical protein
LNEVENVAALAAAATIPKLFPKMDGETVGAAANGARAD